MKLTLTPTEQFFMADEVMVRMWQGTDGNGQPVVALITAIAFTGQSAVLADDLVSIPPPTSEDAQRWAHHILHGTKPNLGRYR
jgi:hypothetical protein